MLQTIIVVIASGVLIFGGYTAGPIPPGNYLMCVFANAAAPITIGLTAKRIVEGANAETAISAAISGIIQLVSGFIGWVFTTLLFLAFLRGWQPPVRAMVSNPFGLWASTLATARLRSSRLSSATKVSRLRSGTTYSKVVYTPIW